MPRAHQSYILRAPALRAGNDSAGNLGTFQWQINGNHFMAPKNFPFP